MARLATIGLETNSATIELTGGTGSSGTGTTSISSAAARSGTYGLRSSSGASNGYSFGDVFVTGVLSRSYFARTYFRVATLPTNDILIMNLNNGNPIAAAVLRSNGNVALYTLSGSTWSQVGSDSSAIATNTWTRLELRALVATGAGDGAELYLDGAQVAIGSALSLTDTPPTDLHVGWEQNAIAPFNQGPGSNLNIDYDDIALNDDQGASQNTWPGSGKAILLLPMHDNSVGSWKAGSAASASANGRLHDALNNTPPVGTATPDAVTAAISNAISGATNPNGDFDVQSYSDLGLDGGASCIEPSAALVGFNFGDVTASTRRAVSFVPLNSFTSATLAVYLAKVGAPTDNVEVAIQADSAGVPSGTDLGVGSIACTSLTTSMVKYTLTVSASLTAGTTYWLVFRRTGAVNGTNNPVMYWSTDGVSTSQTHVQRYDYNGTTWSASGSYVRLHFELLPTTLNSPTINCVQQLIVHGEDISTGAKTGTFKIVSNPDSGTADNVAQGGSSQFGPSAGGAVGTYPTNWVAQRGTVVYAPTVTLNSPPVGRITKTDTGTRAADLCFMGVYVDYTPSAVAGKSIVADTRRVQRNSLLRR